MFLKAIGTVLVNGDFGVIKDTISIEYGSRDSIIYDFKIGFSSYYTGELGDKIIAECKKLGI